MQLEITITNYRFCKSETMIATKYVYVYSKLMEMMTEYENEDYRAFATATLKTMTIRRITITIGNELNNL